MKQNKRLKNNKGFTLIESVITLIAVTIVTGLFMLVVDFAKNTYITMQESSQGQVLCSNLTNAIQDELRYATYVTPESGTGYQNFTYYSQSVGKGELCRIVSHVSDPTKSNKARLYIEFFGGGTSEYFGLVGNDSYIFNLEANIDCKYNKSIQRFHCVITISDSKNGSQIIQSDFYVDPLNKGSL